VVHRPRRHDVLLPYSSMYIPNSFSTDFSTDFCTPEVHCCPWLCPIRQRPAVNSGRDHTAPSERRSPSARNPTQCTNVTDCSQQQQQEHKCIARLTFVMINYEPRNAQYAAETLLLRLGWHLLNII